MSITGTTPPTPGLPSAPAPTLVDLASGRRYDLTDETGLAGRWSIGRGAENAIRVSDPMVGRTHAEVRRDPDGRFALIDLDSRNGTYMHGRKIRRAALEDGEEIMLGATRLRFDDPPATVVAAVAGAAPLTSVALRIDDTPTMLVQSRISVRDAGRLHSSTDFDGPAPLLRDFAKMRAAIELSRVLAAEHDMTALLERLLAVSFDMLPAERGAVLLLDTDSGGRVAEIVRARDGSSSSLTLSTRLIEEVMSQQAGVLTANAELDERFSRSSSLLSQGIRSALCVPMFYPGIGDQAGEILGIMYLDSRVTSGAFSEHDLELFAFLAGQAALAIKNAALVKRVHDAETAVARRLERVVRHLPSGVVLLDNHNRVVLANTQAEELLALLAHSSPGRTLERLGDTPLATILASTSPVEMTVDRPNQRIIRLSAAAFHAGPDSGAVLTLSDVTLERERENRAANEERLALLGRLAGGVAHDFNNLLTVILTSADMAREGASDPQMLEDLDEVRQAAGRAADLTRQLLAFGRREVVQPKVIDLNSHISEIERLLRRTIGSAVNMTIRLDADLPMVEIDPTQFERVVVNLVVNARDAMPEGGGLTIETSVEQPSAAECHRLMLEPGTYARLTVTDQGVGMPPAVMARLFEPFFTTKERGKGTGLGLATIHAAIRQVGGAIAVESHPGRGSAFRVLLPASTAAPVGEPLEQLPRAPTARTILVVEDLAPVLALTRRILEQQGFEVLTATSASEALIAARDHRGRVNLLLTDVIMPGMSGRVLAEQMRQLIPGIGVVFMSGHVNGVIDQDLLDSSGAGFVSKPFTADALIAEMHRVEIGRRDVTAEENAPASAAAATAAETAAAATARAAAATVTAATG